MDNIGFLPVWWDRIGHCPKIYARASTLVVDVETRGLIVPIVACPSELRRAEIVLPIAMYVQ
jgi:hypothetical protein